LLVVLPEGNTALSTGVLSDYEWIEVSKK
jgi:hypothetical protein